MIPVGISYSGGKSSKWLIYAMLNGVLPRPELIQLAYSVAEKVKPQK